MTAERTLRIVGHRPRGIGPGGKPVCAIDAKWTAPPAPDIHQALAYPVGLGCRDVRLVYPCRRWVDWRHELRESDVRLTVHIVRVVGPRDRCERAITRVVRSLPE